jgi:hypothetical protein
VLFRSRDAYNSLNRSQQRQTWYHDVSTDIRRVMPTVTHAVQSSMDGTRGDHRSFVTHDRLPTDHTVDIDLIHFPLSSSHVAVPSLRTAWRQLICHAHSCLQLEWILPRAVV